MAPKTYNLEIGTRSQHKQAVQPQI